LEHPHRSALENHVHRTPRLGNHGLLNVRIGITSESTLMSLLTPFTFSAALTGKAKNIIQLVSKIVLICIFPSRIFDSLWSE
jgi:hypothetical protein